jgi:uncharacterized protein with NAD-binding domain and iron-sulfur cluster
MGSAARFSTILSVTSEGKTRELERVGLIGSGKVTGGDLLLSEFLKNEVLTESEASCLAAFVISIVGHVDMFVSGKPDMFVCMNKKALEYDETYYREMLRTSESRWTLLKQIWHKMLDDENFEKKLRELIKK